MLHCLGRFPKTLAETHCFHTCGKCMSHRGYTCQKITMPTPVLYKTSDVSTESNRCIYKNTYYPLPIACVCKHFTRPEITPA